MTPDAPPPDPNDPPPPPAASPPPGPTAPGGDRPAPPPSAFSQDVNYAQTSARVPERVSRGSFATAVLVLRGAHEVAFDFLLRMVPPMMMSARVVVPYSILGSIAAALEENWTNYRARFGTPVAPPPPPPNVTPPKIADVYAEMKISDEVAPPAYANTLMVTHSYAEFCFDFIADLFPRPVVTCRVYLSALQVPGLLESIKRTVAQVQGQFRPPPPGPPNAGGGPGK